MEKILFKAMLSQFQKDIKENSEEIKNLEKIDLKYCKIKIEINNFLKIIEYYKKLTYQDNRRLPVGTPEPCCFAIKK